MTDWLECYMEDNPRCPYCGEAREVNHDFFDDEGVAVCPFCNREFKYEREECTEYTYNTEPMEGWRYE